MAFPTRSEYESLIYDLSDAVQVLESTLRLYSVSTLTMILEGNLLLANGLDLRIVEVLNFEAGRIQKYSYTIFHNGEKIRWYDPQPHPEVESLQSTFPHRLHEPPNIKQNRKPAPGISFDAPNLPTLIRDCIALGESISNQTD